MRELKFRAINKDNIARGFFDALNHGIFTLKGLINAPSIEIMQYTGLKDKNGKDVYDGDIICDPKADEPEDEGWEIRFNMGSWECVNVRLRRESETIDTYNLYDFGMLGMEVIGNIHENKKP